jgi:hypothetical protein
VLTCVGLGCGSTAYPCGMDLTLTRRGDYAVRAVLFLAGEHGQRSYVKIREVSTAMQLR